MDRTGPVPGGDRVGHPVLVLVHSPLVGPITWRLVAAALERTGRPAVVPDLRVAATGPGPYHRDIADAVVRDVPEQGDLILVGHSGAGPLLPAIAAGLPGRVRGLVYADAGLPHPGAPELNVLPREFDEQLRAMVRDGLLPPWHEWLPSGTLLEILPDPRVRAEFVAEVPRLPYAFFTEAAPDVVWAGAAAYVLMSETYRDHAETARAAGQPVIECSGHHLAGLTAPDTVADKLIVAADAIASEAP
ncbi:alpha/beta fold hydrolase [Nocardia amikacinitolerans]|uniref:alpha/beta fold hydrolase n=1 Tax=Nocardia amikacinitolerans TaxID=756689 RepID=UPI0020A464F4|nr:alpha/beta hydrolase [Nocardia amikacinitolerans]MCP2274991.1 Alpha/beta hydrolase family [Nocardia amikacinitolerans]